MTLKSIPLLLLGCIGGIIPLLAQDSSYHNYLYDSRTAYFRQLPVAKKPVIFFGDSITQWGDWCEFLGKANILNRGIAGDNTNGLLARVDEVIRHRPLKLFILVGTNDLNKHMPAASIVATYRRIISAVQAASPGTRIFVQSVLPINNQLIGRQYYTGTNEQIIALNAGLKEMANSLQLTFVNVYDALLDNTGQMDARYTYDGLHLSGEGYLKWVQVLKQQRLI
ncbi:GDSL-type esterase/lipase family protein [Chitinophaga eiseniae]|uniref:GDSL family lipase n=1 Tax=Chitinophaga eiseniae TaxID=634771 RepID=A0A847SU94_9BACT|nr:GDSL-type esterase/lipase family protein [Chitinophaga eiseniae]NLR81396.1 GDSL family lipase [Chitinophaga eiseniae]